jgi:hypothetical protein
MWFSQVVFSYLGRKKKEREQFVLFKVGIFQNGLNEK